MDKPLLRAEGVAHIYPALRGPQPVAALQHVSFQIPQYQFCSIVGKSGCGKTTLLRIIAGLLRPTSGQITLNGDVVLRPSAALSVVFQDYSKSLLPWKTVQENVRLGLRTLQDGKGRRLDKGEEERRVRSYLELVGLLTSAQKYPWQLSGGMQQRVAIARAVARQPKVLLMDEPFGALDAPTRFELEDQLLKIAKEFGITVLMITHDIDEAVYMSDRVLVISRDGELGSGAAKNERDGDILIELPKPRHQIETRANPLFGEYRARIFQKLHLVPDEARELISA